MPENLAHNLNEILMYSRPAHNELGTIVNLTYPYSIHIHIYIIIYVLLISTLSRDIQTSLVYLLSLDEMRHVTLSSLATGAVLFFYLQGIDDPTLFVSEILLNIYICIYIGKKFIKKNMPDVFVQDLSLKLGTIHTRVLYKVISCLFCA